jgi:hypothetical protein
MLLILAFSVYSASAQISFNTGNSQLDSDLIVINANASADFGSFKADMKLTYNVTDKKIELMKINLDMAPGEIYLALEISKLAKISLDNVLSIYKTHKSKGWGFIAKQAGIKPGSAEFHQLKNGASSKKEKGPGKEQSQAKGNKNKKKK